MSQREQKSGKGTPLSTRQALPALPLLHRYQYFETMKWQLADSYTSLPGEFFSRVGLSPAPKPGIVAYNPALARSLGLPGVAGADDLAYWSGHSLPSGVPLPFAQAYAGHQFGHFTNLGDGRAAVLGELQDPSGQVWDLQLKGSGPTPYSRRGDGKAALGPCLRELLISENFAALGIPTSRTLAVFTTGETIRRETLLPGAVLVRAAHSHLRVGTFEYAAARGGYRLLHPLAEYAIDRHYPACRRSRRPYSALFLAVAHAQAKLVASWMGVGFVHGVMNTDNMTISGQSLDFGPCAFIDSYAADAVFSSIDALGRYAYGQQPGIAVWNLTRLAEAMMPLFAWEADPGADPDEAAQRLGQSIAQELVDGLPDLLEDALNAVWAAKLGLPAGHPQTLELISGLLDYMETNQADFTATFYALATAATGGQNTGMAPASPSTSRDNNQYTRAAVPPNSRQGRSDELLPPEEWLAAWRTAWSKSGVEELHAMQKANPRIIARNYWVEQALNAATEGDCASLNELWTALLQPYSVPSPANAELDRFATPGSVATEPYVTYCGT